MTASPERNPYRPGVGKRPLVLAGREGEIQRFLATLRGSPEIPANIRLTGLRGVGKTVLLSEFDDQAKRAGWATVLLELEPRHNTEQAILASIGASIDRAVAALTAVGRIRRGLGRAAALAAGLGFTYNDVRMSFDPTTVVRGQEDLGRKLYDACQASGNAGRAGFAVLLDEAQVLTDEQERDGEHPLSMLLAAVAALQKLGAPVALVLCGLPTLTGNLLRARTYVERMFRGMEIGSLTAEAARSAFVEPLAGTGTAADADLVARVLQSVEGYPYFIQLWGAELWDATVTAGTRRFSVELLEAIEPEIYIRLDLDFYEPRIATLRPAEQDVLQSAAQCSYPPLLVADLQGATDKSPGNVNVLLGRMVSGGVLYRLRKGQYEFTAPKFHAYLRRRAERLAIRE